MSDTSWFDQLFPLKCEPDCEACEAERGLSEDEDCGCQVIDYAWGDYEGGMVDVVQCSDPGCPRAKALAEDGKP